MNEVLFQPPKGQFVAEEDREIVLDSQDKIVLDVCQKSLFEMGHLYFMETMVISRSSGLNVVV